MLVIDSDEKCQAEIQAMLDRHSMPWRSALSGKAGLAALEEKLPSIIILEYKLPDIDGIDVLAAIRHSAKAGFIPVIFLAAAGGKEVVTRAGIYYVNDFLVKPFQRFELIDRIILHTDFISEQKARDFLRVMHWPDDALGKKILQDLPQLKGTKFFSLSDNDLRYCAILSSETRASGFQTLSIKQLADQLSIFVKGPVTWSRVWPPPFYPSGVTTNAKMSVSPMELYRALRVANP